MSKRLSHRRMEDGSRVMTTRTDLSVHSESVQSSYFRCLQEQPLVSLPR